MHVTPLDLFRWVATHLVAVLVFSATLLLPTGVFASTDGPCDSVPSTAPISFTLQMHGGARASRDIVVPAQSDMLVTASEKGLDVLVEAISGGQTIERAATPIYKTGITRLILRAQSVRRISLVVQALGDPGVRGGVVIRVFPVSMTAVNDACWRVQRLLALADAFYFRAWEAVAEVVKGDDGSQSDVDAVGKYRAAASLYRAAAEQTSEPALRAYAELATSEVLFDFVGDVRGSRSWAQAAQRTYQSLGDRYGVARARLFEAIALFAIGETDSEANRAARELRQARDEFLSLATFFAGRGESFEQAATLGYLGAVYAAQGLVDEAIRTYRRTLPLFEGLGEEYWKVCADESIAMSEMTLGRVHDAALRFSRLLAYTRWGESAWPTELLFILNNSANVNRLAGHMDLALRQYAHAIQLERRLQDTFSYSHSLLGIGSVYEALGESDRALDFYRQGLALPGATVLVSDRVASLRSTANVLRSQGHVQEALAMHETALSYALTAAQRAAVQVQRATDLAALGRNEAALQQLKSVVGDRYSGHTVVRAQALLERGKIHMSMGKLSAAEADLRSAIATLDSGESPVDAFSAWTALAQAQYKSGSTPQALDSLTHALQLAEEVRLQSAIPELRASLLQPLRPAFDLKIAMLAERYFVSGEAQNAATQEQDAKEALDTAEQARARAFADFERLDLGRSADQARLLERRRSFYRELADLHFQLESGRDDRGEGDKRLSAIRSKISALRVQLDETDAQINTRASFKQAEAIDESWILNRQGIRADTAVVEYWLGTEDAIAWVVSRDRLTMIRLGASAKITEAALTFHDSLRAFGRVPASARLDASAHLYALCIQPLEQYIAPYHTLIFAPDGALHYIPFGALRAAGGDRSHFLVEDHDIAETPSIRVLLDQSSASAVRATPAERLLLIADPVYTEDDTRLHSIARRNVDSKESDLRSIVFRSSYGASLPRLVYTAREADAIASLFTPDHVDRLEGFVATRDRFLGAPLDRYRIIHVATHATTDAQILGLSALALSAFDPTGKKIDNLVFATDFMNLRLNADLVVLSACDTSLGKDVAGEGLMGLRYVVLARGARAVVASLWEVPDEGTSELMTTFYGFYQGGKKSAPAALSEAMRTMIEGAHADPSEWGSFVATISALGHQR